MPSLNVSAPLLNAFVSLAHARQFTLAASRCHMSQSAFSQAIARLESQVGTRLFERSTRSVTLTPEGELLLPVAQRVLDDLQAAFGELRERAGRRQGKVAIAALPSLAAEWLPGVIAEYRVSYPGIALTLLDVMLDRSLSLVRDGTVDFAINASAGLEDEFDTRPLFEDGFFLVCRPDHRLARRPHVRLADLGGEAYVHTTRTASMWRQIYPYLREVPIRDTGLEVSYLSTLAGLIANGVGVSVVTGVSLFNFTRAGLVAVPVADKGLRYQVAIVRRRGRNPSVAARALEDLVAARVPAPSRGTARRPKTR